MGGIIGKLWVGGMTLHPMHRQPARQAAATADLDHVTEGGRAGRLADEACVEDLAARDEPVEHLPSAVDRRPLLVASDQQADRTVKRGSALVQVTLGRRD